MRRSRIFFLEEEEEEEEEMEDETDECQAVDVLGSLFSCSS